MDITEKQLEDLIYNGYMQENGDSALANIGLELEGYMLRQLDLPGFGIADLVLFQTISFDSFCVNIIELKKDKIDFSTLKQALRYRLGIEAALEHTYKMSKEFINTHFLFEVTLIGSTVSEMLGFAPHLLSNDIHLYTYKLDAFNGLRFKKVAYNGYKESNKFKSMRIPEKVVENMATISKLEFDQITRKETILPF